jgi:acetolactate synthase I/II/III large subunit
VLLHVETGTLAMAGALHNAAKGRAPVLIWAGASPSTIEGEVLGGRTEFIQFQQEFASSLNETDKSSVHDQRGIVRGYVKYNNEVHSPGKEY